MQYQTFTFILFEGKGALEEETNELSLSECWTEVH